VTRAFCSAATSYSQLKSKIGDKLLEFVVAHKDPATSVWSRIFYFSLSICGYCSAFCSWRNATVMCRTVFQIHLLCSINLIMKGNEEKGGFRKEKSLGIPYGIRKEQTFLRKMIFGRRIPGSPVPFKKKT